MSLLLLTQVLDEFILHAGPAKELFRKEKNKKQLEEKTCIMGEISPTNFCLCCKCKYEISQTFIIEYT